MKSKKIRKKYIKRVLRFFVKKLINFIERLISIIKRLYIGVSIISTLTVFSGIFLYIIGNIFNYYKTDDDLILDHIQETLDKDYVINEIVSSDLHGFGNNSIIVITHKIPYEFDFETGAIDPRTQILIFDEVNNGILNQLYNLCGFGSNYSLRYQFALASDGYGASYGAEIDDIIDLNGDKIPEICIIFYESGGGSAGNYINGIFGYSIRDRKYHLVGTYDISDNERGSGEYYNYYDSDEKFNLSTASLSDNNFFWDTGHGTYLISTTHTIEAEESNADPHTHSIYVYKFAEGSAYIQMDLIYSGEIPGKRKYCSEEFLVEYIINNNLFDDGSGWEF